MSNDIFTQRDAFDDFSEHESETRRRVLHIFYFLIF
jgi:hypothetical protein